MFWDDGNDVGLMFWILIQSVTVQNHIIFGKKKLFEQPWNLLTLGECIHSPLYNYTAIYTQASWLQKAVPVVTQWLELWTLDWQNV